MIISVQIVYDVDLPSSYSLYYKWRWQL